MPSKTDVDRAIAICVEGRDIHADYVGWLERGELPVATDGTVAGNVGGADWHRRWVDNYNHVLAMLSKTPVEP